jgi:hypothetical protein
MRMTNSNKTETTDDRSLLIRLGGLAGLVAIAVHMVVNTVLKSFPAENLTLDQLQAYFQQEANTWAIVHGLRYFAIAGIVFMVVGLYLRTNRQGAPSENGWRVIGLVGATLWLANLMITNGIEMFAFLDFNQMDGKPELFWMVFAMTRVLFTAEMIAWTIVTFGFSMGGLRSKTLPGWLGYSGILLSSVGFFSSITIVDVLGGGWTTNLATVAAPGIILWFVCACLYMLLRGAKA